MRRPLAVVAVLLVLLGTLLVGVPPAAAVPPNQPVVGMAATPSGNGYWLVAADGGVFTFGDARFFGSAGDVPLRRPIVGMAATPTGDGYWLVASDGGIFTYGRAGFHGSAGDLPLRQPIVGMARTPTGGGYWLVAADGGIFTYGDAPFHGSLGSLRLNQPIVGIAPTPSGAGYWLVAADGGIFTFGNAGFHGSLGSVRLNQPIVGIAATPSGAGYWLVAADGGIFTFGDAPFLGAGGGRQVVGMADRPAGPGYWTVAADGRVDTLGGAPDLGGLGTPQLTVTPVVTGLDIPWDVAFTPDGTMLFTERRGRLSAFVGGQRRTLAEPADTFAQSENGMMSLAVDPDFASNRRIYVCTGYEQGAVRDVRVQTWVVNGGYTGATRVQNPLLGGMPVSSGRHSGCRLLIGPDGYLWIATGDRATGTVPQNLDSLGGKVLRIDRTTGAAAPGNLRGPVYTYGHRNPQGLAIEPLTRQVYAAEHGPTVDDEVNVIQAGGNYGWDPVPGYNESVPMTDLAKFPGAIPAIWRSGSPTIAPSGATFLVGPAWQSWQGALALGILRGQHLRLLFLGLDGRPVAELAVLRNVGRLRSVTMGPDGSLYMTTSNGGGQDRILRVTPS